MLGCPSPTAGRRPARSTIARGHSAAAGLIPHPNEITNTPLRTLHTGDDDLISLSGGVPNPVLAVVSSTEHYWVTLAKRRSCLIPARTVGDSTSRQMGRICAGNDDRSNDCGCVSNE